MKCLQCYQPIESGIFHLLCAKKLFGVTQAPEFSTTLKQIEEVATQFLSRRLTVTGVQRKLSLHISKKDKLRLTLIGGMGGGFILKPPSAEYPQLPENEALTMKLAEYCGIKVAANSLFPMADGHLAYITKRFDRTDKLKKIHVEDLCQLSEVATEQKYRSSHEKAGKIILKYSSVPGDDILRYFELVLFCFLTGNADMHLKNFSLVTEDPTFVHLSPAYDLLSSRLVIEEKFDSEELALTINGKKNKIGKKDFLNLAETLKILPRVCQKVLSEMVQRLGDAENIIRSSFLSEELQERYAALIHSRIKALEK